MDAHDMLWLGCFESRGDKLDRMCVVPMAQEARGLDAGPRLREKLVGRGDNRSAHSGENYEGGVEPRRSWRALV